MRSNIIEQSLTNAMEFTGGLTHGRGLKESVLSTWVLGIVNLHNECDGVEEFCGVNFESSEQHVQLRKSRITGII